MLGDRRLARVARLTLQLYIERPNISLDKIARDGAAIVQLAYLRRLKREQIALLAGISAHYGARVLRGISKCGTRYALKFETKKYRCEETGHALQIA
jgi:hypothetical protein